MEIVYRNVRFNEKVDRCLRRRWKRHGDLSIRVREALDKVNLHDVELLDVDCSRVHAMQVGVFNSHVDRRPRGGSAARMLCEHLGE